jgi:hypothetical protein
MQSIKIIKADSSLLFLRIYNNMKNLLPFQLFEDFSSQETLDEDQIKWLDRCTGGTWKLNPSTGLIDVDGDFYCGQQDLTDFKGVAFGHINGYFYCRVNRLTSLVGAPQTVDGYFYCHDNQLTDLKGAPQKVGGGFSCDSNQLTDLEGAPQKVGGFSCDGNQLTDLKGAPQSVGGRFFCRNNQLTSLVGAPQKVGGNFYCNDNRLTNLEGAPQTVNGNFYCDNNQLTSLVGAPQTVNGNFYCSDNPVPEETLASIFALMKKGKSYQQALEEHWPEMDNEDMILMYKDLKDLTPEEIRRYEALATVSRIKNYL